MIVVPPPGVDYRTPDQVIFAWYMDKSFLISSGSAASAHGYLDRDRAEVAGIDEVVVQCDGGRLLVTLTKMTGDGWMMRYSPGIDDSVQAAQLPHAR